MLRRAVLLALATMALAACGAPPEFPTNSPVPKDQYSLGPNDKPKPPPTPKGVAHFEMEPETRPRIVAVVATSAVIFLAALLLSLAMRVLHRFTGAGIGAAFLGPVIAVAMAARHLMHMLMGFVGSPFDFAGFALAIWNENQPILASFYCGSVLLVILVVIVAFTKRDAETGGFVTSSTLLLAIVCAVVGFLSFVSMSRLLLAMADPIMSDSLPRSLSLKYTSLGGAARALQFRTIMTLSASAVAVLLLVLTLIVSFFVRRLRGRLLISLLALIVMLGATALAYTWSEVLATSARTGHVPDTILTR